MKKRDLITVVAAAAIISALFYGPFLDNYFVWDDFWMLENYYKGNLKDFLLGFADLRIFGNLILWLNCNISELNPVGYSLISIGAHIINSVILFLLIHSLSGNRLFSMSTAVIFAASAVGCDAIMWKDAFLTVTGVFFCLLILYLYAEGRKCDSRFFRNTALVLFLLAMFNKEEIASVPLVIIFIEKLFLGHGEGFLSKLKKVLPYFLVIIIYIVLSIMVSRFLNIQQEQFERFLTFRPLHTLFSGFTSFFISPEGKLNWNDPFLYSTLLLVAFFVLLLKDKKWVLFGLGWAFLTFLPQSFTGMTRYDAPHLINSISRHLYLPSVGPAIVFSAILLWGKEHFRQKVFVATTALFFAVFILFNYERVNTRGRQWQDVGMTMKWFLYSLKDIQPSFPENSYVRVINGPTGKSYTQRALRAFYRNPKIFCIDEPKEGAYVYLYLNDYIVDEHNSLMRLVSYVKKEDIPYILMFYEFKRENKEKLEMLRAISQAKPYEADIHFRLAVTYRKMNMYDDAISEYKAALAIKADDKNPL